MKTCQYENCINILRKDNTIGFCRTHRYSSPSYKEKDRIRNKDSVRKQARETRTKEWRKNNRDKVNSTWNKWKANNPEAFQIILDKKTSVRRFRFKNQFAEPVARKVVWDRDKGICCLCNLPADENNWWLEHLIPLSRGGMHSYSNVGVSHPVCNNRKNSKLISELEVV